MNLLDDGLVCEWHDFGDNDMEKFNELKASWAIHLRRKISAWQEERIIVLKIGKIDCLGLRGGSSPRQALVDLARWSASPLGGPQKPIYHMWPTNGTSK